MRRRAWAAAMVAALLVAGGSSAAIAARTRHESASLAHRAAVVAPSASGSPDPSDLDPGADAIAKKEAIMRAHGFERGTPPPLSATPEPTPAWTPGVTYNKEGPAPGEEFLATSHWNGETSAGHVVVYAGQAGIGSPNGQVRVWYSTTGPTGTKLSTTTLPGTGPLTIRSANGATLTLTDPAGRRHYYNANTATWVAG